jgi:hypothetical protein
MSRKDEFEGARSFSVEIPAEDIEMYRAIHEGAKLQHSVESAMEQAPVNLRDEHSLRAHLVSAHLMNENHFWRDGTNEDHPKMDPIDWDAADARGGMPPMSHRDLRALHDDDHAEFPEDPYSTVGHDHFHH